jgi:hypothetical protein
VPILWVKVPHSYIKQANRKGKLIKTNVLYERSKGRVVSFHEAVNNSVCRGLNDEMINE